VAHKLAGQFVVSKANTDNDEFHEQQQVFWKMVVKDENDNVIKTKQVSEHQTTSEEEFTDYDKDTDSFAKKFKGLFDL
jgi:hypothetical protein